MFKSSNTIILVIIVLGIVVITLLLVRNWRDRKKILPPGAGDDPVREKRRDRQRRQGRI